MIRKSTCPIYRMPVIFCDDTTEGNRVSAQLGVDKKHTHEPDDKGDGGSTDVINGTLLLCLYQPDLSLLAHECVHAASKTLSERGIKGDPKDDHEHLTYLTEWYFNEWIKKMGWKVTIKTRKGWPAT